MEWINTKDGLPKYQEPVGIPRGDAFPFSIIEYNTPNKYLCYTSLDVFEICDIEKDGTWDGDLREGEYVTHYMLLPEPPTSNP